MRSNPQATVVSQNHRIWHEDISRRKAAKCGTPALRPRDIINDGRKELGNPHASGKHDDYCLIFIKQHSTCVAKNWIGYIDVERGQFGADKSGVSDFEYGSSD